MWKIVKKIIKFSGDKSGRIKASIFTAFIHSIFLSLQYAAIYWFIKEFFNNSLTLHTIFICSALLFISLIGGSIFKAITYKLQSWASNYVAARERLNIGEHLKRVPMGFFNEKNLGDITAALTSDITYYENKAADTLDLTINGSIISIVSCIVLLFFDWRIGIIFLLGFIGSILIMELIQKKSQSILPEHKKAEANAISETLEFIRGSSVFRLFHMGGKSVKNLKNGYGKYSDTSCDLELKIFPYTAAIYCVLRLASAIIILIVPFLVLNNKMDFATAILVIIYNFQIFNPVEQLTIASNSIRTLETVMNNIDAIRNFPQIDENGKDISLENFDINFEHVSFCYNKTEKVIDDVSFHIPANTMTAIVGASGSGKSTIARLIVRFWDVSQGSIKIGNVDIKELTCDSLLRNISIVFQNVYLFNDTIAANIKYGNPNATQEEVEEAAKKACCHEFIMSLSDGYNTVVGENGSHLSGGEKQRISIARAILKDTPIVLLDEATSSVDSDNEVFIQQAINELVKDKTLIVIAHRLPTVIGANQIIVIDNGRISQCGTHEDLLKQKGQYKKHWEIGQKSAQWQLN